MSHAPTAVVTTIHAPTSALHALASRLHTVVIGDRKTPAGWKLDGVEYVSLRNQPQLGLALHAYTKVGHYARKNLGYLLAVRDGATVIYDTDDDNTPNAAWRVRLATCNAGAIDRPGWCNIYRHFNTASGQQIWPRGFPLQHLADEDAVESSEQPRHCVIQQGLADKAPDVDAVWRLTQLRDVQFQDEPKSLALGPGVWCPFNSQTTWWWPEAYPFLYLPIHAPFRMTDIWRSFVAQRCLWTQGHRVAFHAPAEVDQDRNPHDLLADFADEVPGYLTNHQFAAVLNDIQFPFGPRYTATDKLVACYRALISAKLLPREEMACVLAWARDYNAILSNRRGAP